MVVLISDCPPNDDEENDAHRKEDATSARVPRRSRLGLGLDFIGHIDTCVRQPGYLGGITGEPFPGISGNGSNPKTVNEVL
jgi:hypothetical protein